jgi:hypothetical protein
LEAELAKSKAREELEARRGDALLAQVVQLKHELQEIREAAVLEGVTTVPRRMGRGRWRTGCGCCGTRASDRRDGSSRCSAG